MDAWKDNLMKLRRMIEQNYMGGGKGNLILLKGTDGFRPVQSLPNVTVRFAGTDNIVIAEKSRLNFRNCAGISIMLGSRSLLYFSESSYRIRNLILAGKRSRDSLIYIGKDLSCNQCTIHVNENSSIFIGNDCQIAAQVTMFANDGHAIFSDGKLLNPPGDILIEDHVWIGFDVTVLKNAHLYRNSIVGAKTLVTQRSGREARTREGLVLSGNPAVVLREGCTWDRRGPANFLP